MKFFHSSQSLLSCLTHTSKLDGNSIGEIESYQRRPCCESIASREPSQTLNSFISTRIQMIGYVFWLLFFEKGVNYTSTFPIRVEAHIGNEFHSDAEVRVCKKYRERHLRCLLKHWQSTSIYLWLIKLIIQPLVLKTRRRVILIKRYNWHFLFICAYFL